VKKFLFLIIAPFFMFLPGAAIACPEISLDGVELNYSGKQLYEARSFSVIAGGEENISRCGIRNNTDGAPEGFVAEAPDFELYYQGGGYELEFRVESDCDSILLINTGSGNWYFDDDDNGNLDAKIRLGRASDGWYDIWIGTLERGNCDARLILESF